ncbi:MAG: Crp/Fnr family transcriptional regulator [Burkholderiaceae bacterium]
MTQLASNRPPPANTTETFSPPSQWLKELRLAVGEAAIVRHRRGEFLFRQGEVTDRFYVLLTGRCQVVTVNNDGNESLLNIMGPGSLIGEAGALLAVPRHAVARMLVDSTLVRFDVASLLSVLRRHPQLIHPILHQMASKQRQLVGRLRGSLFSTPDQRVAQLLVELAQSQAGGRATARSLTLHLTHEAIANLTGLSRVTVTRAFRTLRDSRAIACDGRRITLLKRFPFEAPLSTQRPRSGPENPSRGGRP